MRTLVTISCRKTSKPNLKVTIKSHFTVFLSLYKFRPSFEVIIISYFTYVNPSYYFLSLTKSFKIILRSLLNDISPMWTLFKISCLKKVET